jgi:hypothetical protein
MLACCPAAALLEPLKDALQSSAGADLQIIVRSKDQQQQQMAALLDSIRAVDGACVGTLPKEQQSGQLAELWAQQLADSGLPTCDATAGTTRHVCCVCCAFYMHVVVRCVAGQAVACSMPQGVQLGSRMGAACCVSIYPPALLHRMVASGTRSICHLRSASAWHS